MDIKTRIASLYQRATANPVVALAWVTFAAVAWLNVAKIGVLLWGICKLAAFAQVGNWVDCRRFPDDQPEQLVGVEQGTAWKRKSWIICASIIAGALAP